MTATYTREFYDIIRAGCRASAAAVAPIVMDLLGLPEPRVIDVGCGEGWWAETFAELGAESIGIDGAYVASSPLGSCFIPHDINTPLPEHLAGRFDLAVSLEVAEHLPAGRAESFIGELCALAPVVLFSAAIPGQGGAGHVNERWPSYWAGLFNMSGFQVSGALRFQIWDDDRVENWYRQNLLVAARDPQSKPLKALFKSPLSPPWPLVHPVLFDARRQ